MFLIDILFCIGADGRPVAIPETIKNKTAFTDLDKPPELGKWFAIMILTNKSVLHYSKENNGITICKIRQLKKLGYKPILVIKKNNIYVIFYYNYINFINYIYI